MKSTFFGNSTTTIATLLFVLVSGSGAIGQDAIGGIVGGPKNPGQAAYIEQIRHAPPGNVPGIPEPILLWPNGAPEAVPDASGVFTDEDKPALYAFPAPADTNTGAAFLIIPGGAFTNRGMDSEGVQIAKFLNRHGIAGFVLRYRIGPNYPRRSISTMDGHRAMRYIRAHAANHKISPERIGTIGFSAGAELAAPSAVLFGDFDKKNSDPGDPLPDGSRMPPRTWRRSRNSRLSLQGEPRWM